ncbi:MAG TPA: biotin/lipoyl-containing protein [Vicinamibacterales bacterium]|nr:biotin/lipoyl-containing protein [Vicinamibacterales bacterium]
MSNGWYVVKDGDRQVRVGVANDAHATWIFLDGNVWKIDRQEAAGSKRGKTRGESSVMAPMPATVVTINTAPGKTVNEGETIIVLEAMKMELPIKAPRSGVVKAITCAKGELVQPGVNLVEIE